MKTEELRFEIDLGRDARGSLGLVLDHTRDANDPENLAPICVEEVFDGGPAAVAESDGGERMQVGDELTHVDGTFLGGMQWDDVMELLRKEKMRLSLVRHVIVQDEDTDHQAQEQGSEGVQEQEQGKEQEPPSVASGDSADVSGGTA